MPARKKAKEKRVEELDNVNYQPIVLLSRMLMPKSAKAAAVEPTVSKKAEASAPPSEAAAEPTFSKQVEAPAPPSEDAPNLRRRSMPRSAKTAAASKLVEESALSPEDAAEPTFSKQVEAPAPPSDAAASKLVEESALSPEGWTNEHIQTLLTRMRTNLPDSRSLLNAQRKMCWDQVAFHPFTAEMCKKKWLEMSKKIPRTRTLADLVNDALGAFENPFRKHHYKIYKHIYIDFPTRPRHPNKYFFLEKRAELKEQHPEMNNFQLVNFSQTKYRLLPEEEKAKYTEKTKGEEAEFFRRHAQVREKYPHLNFCAPKIRDPDTMKRPPRPPRKKRKARSTPPTPSTPPTHPTLAEIKVLMKKVIPTATSLFCGEQMLKAPRSHGKESRLRFGKLSASFRDLPQEQKEIYVQRRERLQEEYIQKLRNWVNNLSALEKREFYKQNPTKRCLLSSNCWTGKGHQFCHAKKKDSGGRRRTSFDEQNEEGSKGRSAKRTSDSEDDDIEIDTSSSEDDGPHNCGEKANDRDVQLEGWESSCSDGSSSEGEH